MSFILIECDPKINPMDDSVRMEVTGLLIPADKFEKVFGKKPDEFREQLYGILGKPVILDENEIEVGFVKTFHMDKSGLNVTLEVSSPSSAQSRTKTELIELKKRYYEGNPLKISLNFEMLYEAHNSYSFMRMLSVSFCKETILNVGYPSKVKFFE